MLLIYHYTTIDRASEGHGVVANVRAVRAVRAEGTLRKKARTEIQKTTKGERVILLREKR